MQLQARQALSGLVACGSASLACLSVSLLSLFVSLDMAAGRTRNYYDAMEASEPSGVNKIFGEFAE